MDKECGARISGIIAENQQAHQVVASEREELLSLTSRKSKPVRLLDRHGDRDYKVPFVQLLPSPQGEELSLRSISLDSGLHVSHLNRIFLV